MKRIDYERKVKETLTYYEKAGIILSNAEKERIEVADLGLGQIDQV